MKTKNFSALSYPLKILLHLSEMVRSCRVWAVQMTARWTGIMLHCLKARRPWALSLTYRMPESKLIWKGTEFFLYWPNFHRRKSVFLCSRFYIYLCFKRMHAPFFLVRLLSIACYAGCPSLWPCFIVCAYGKLRRGSRINTDRFPERAPKAQASRGVRAHGPPGNVLDFNSLKSPFLGFGVIQTGYWPVPFTLDEALQLGKSFIY